MNKTNTSFKSALVVGIAGGSGSGKTTFARGLFEAFGHERAAILAQDSYYIDQSGRFDHDGGAVNFDHPSALDFNLMGEHLSMLKQGVTVQVPRYDFATHKRLTQTQFMEPRPLIIVDGILILGQPQVYKHFNYSIFVHCDESLRFERRLHRDVRERGRDPEGVKEQFLKQVRPMHDQFVEPSQANATDHVYVDSFEAQLQHFIIKLRRELYPN